MGTVEPRECRYMEMIEEALRDWEGGCLTQDQAAALLGEHADVSARGGESRLGAFAMVTPN